MCRISIRSRRYCDRLMPWLAGDSYQSDNRWTWSKVLHYQWKNESISESKCLTVLVYRMQSCIAWADKEPHKTINKVDIHLVAIKNI